MPELPEVEVVKRSLKRKIQNLVIKKVKIIHKKIEEIQSQFKENINLSE